MRIVSYELHPEISGTGRFVEKEGTLVDFMVEMQIIGDDAIIPPLEILNEILSEGMWPRSGCWEPFQITAEEYEQLCNELTEINGKEIKRIDPPDWVTNAKAFSYWIIEYQHGIPGKENMELTEEISRISNEIVNALIRKDFALAEQLEKQRELVKLKRDESIRKYKLY